MSVTSRSRRGAPIRVLAGALPLLLAAVSPAARAGDGRIEINQTRALVGNVTPGDAPGFPVRLTQPGSYLLTGELLVDSLVVNGIEIEADDVAIDLNGFSIVGPGVCSETDGALTCNGAANFAVLQPLPFQRASVRNGFLQGFGTGVFLAGHGARVRGVVARWMNNNALAVGFSALVDRSVAVEGRSTGILVNGGRVSESVARANGSGGIVAERVTACAASANDGLGIRGTREVSDSAASDNGGAGIVGGDRAVVSGNAARGNGFRLGGAGILAGDGAVVRSNLASGNRSEGIAAGDGSNVSGNAAFDNGDDGIDVGDGASVQENLAVSNAFYGLSFSGEGAGFRANTVRENDEGAVAGTAVDAGANACDGSLGC